MAIQNIEAGQKDWVKVLNDNFTALDGSDIKVTDLTTSGVVMTNGFSQVDGAPNQLAWRVYESKSTGERLFTEVKGQVSASSYSGNSIKFAEIAGPSQPVLPFVIGGTGMASASNSVTGIFQVSLGWENNQLELYISGFRDGGGTLDGWLPFNLLYV